MNRSADVFAATKNPPALAVWSVKACNKIYTGYRLCVFVLIRLTRKQGRSSKRKSVLVFLFARFSVNFISFFACYRYFIITRSKTFISIGLATWSFMPASSAACRSSEKAFAVIARMGISAFFRSSICLIFFVVS